MPAPLDLNSIHGAVFAAHPDALLLTDERRIIVLANPAAARLLGCASDRLCGLPTERFIPTALNAPPMREQFGVMLRREDGSQAMVDIVWSRLEGACPALILVTVRTTASHPHVDVALRRARYSECVAELGRLAVDSHDPYALLRHVPAAAADVTGADTSVLWRLEPDQLALRVVRGISLTDEEPKGALIANQPHTPPGYALARAEPIVINDYRQERRFEVPPWILQQGFVSGILVPLRDRGRMVGVLALRSRQPQHFGDDEVYFLRSLANLLSSSLQRAETEEALAHAERLQGIGRLTGSIAHDFNNLLTVIQGNLQMLAELPVVHDDAGRRHVAAAMHASQLGADLNSRLLAFSRRQVLRPARVDLAVTLHALADMLRRLFDPRIHITVDVTPGCPACRADPGQLESALLNIAINARDAMQDGGLLVLEAAPAANDFVAITISDNGKGMSPWELSHAFEPFFTTKERGHGTGLGLSTVHGFADQSNGSITLESGLSCGTTVTLSIPRWHGIEGAAPETAGALLPLGLRVLLVEDEAEVREVARAALMALGCAVTTGGNAGQALLALRNDPPYDVLVTDIALGRGMRGTELAEHARQLNPHMAVLLVSGFASDVLQSAESLSWELLRKPYSRDQLAHALATVLAAGAG